MTSLMHESYDRVILAERAAQVAWVNEHAWKHAATRRPSWRVEVARRLVAFAARIAPTVTAPSSRTHTLAP
jgi:hypothetical protein